MSDWTDFIEHAELTDVGLRRSNNQDSHTWMLAGSVDDFRRRGHVFMVADGMGAHAAGELASKIATDMVPLTYNKLLDESAAEALRKAVEQANHRIHSRGQANLDFKGMGTTCSAMALLPQGAIIAHVGDSRAYRLRGNRLEQLTFDHSLVWEMMAAGRANDVQSGAIPKNIITRSLGPSEAVQVDVEGPFPLATGDTFLLCSDGLSGQVTDDELGVILQALSPRDAAEVLIHLANLRGGPDNITVIIARVKQSPAELSAGASPASGGGVLPWLVLGAMTATTAGLGAVGQVLPAIGSAAVAMAAGLSIMARKLRRGGTIIPRSNSAPLGRGPHRSRVCSIDRDMVDKFASIVQQLRDAAVQKGWSVQWERFNAHQKRAEASTVAGNLLVALQEYCHAIRFIMQELKVHRQKPETTPQVELEP